MLRFSDDEKTYKFAEHDDRIPRIGFNLMLDCNENPFGQKQAENFATDVLKNMASVADYLSERKEKRFIATDFGENAWSDREFCKVLEDFSSRGETIERIYPLIPMQEGMLLKHISEPKSHAYRLSAFTN